MTGYGAAASERDGLKVQVEIRSGNGRFSEVRLRLPSELAPYEPELRRSVAEKVRRGRVDVSISISSEEPPRMTARVNRVLARTLLEGAESLKKEFNLVGTVSLSDILALPGLVEVERPGGGGADERLLQAVRATLDTALEAHDAARLREGNQLAHDLGQRLESIRRLGGEIEARAALAPQTARDRLMERIRRLTGDLTLDPGRLEQEVAYQAERSDITEELVRLYAHLDAGAVLVGSTEPAGKGLEFLLQEIGRETNTISSKSSDLEITRCALAIKSEVEKMREQVQNVE
jgi:uncharacterized protein (TIGR00255 family)